jgi:LacI family transcriptional regulator
MYARTFMATSTAGRRSDVASRKEVAELAGVSEATVSRVLNGVGPVREETRRRVLEAARQLNYQIHALAASFARGRSGNLGVVLPHVPKVRLFSTYYFSEMLGGIGEAARERGMGLLLLYRSPGEAYDYVPLFRSVRIDACIVLGASSLPEEETGIRAMAEEGLPFCLIDHRSADGRASSVGAAHEEGSRRAVEHLLENGYRKIGFLNGSPWYSPSREREAGYTRALREAGLEPDPKRMFSGNYSRTSGRRAAEAVCERLRDLDAMFVANDRMAIGLMQALRERGVRVPDDLAIVGCDDSDAAAMVDPPLTSVRVPFGEMGRTAAERLLDRLPDWRGPESVFHETLPTELVVRESSAPRS